MTCMSPAPRAGGWTLPIVVVAAQVLLAGPSSGDEAQTRAAARSALTKYGDSIITVRLAVKNRVVFQGRERNSSESSLEIAGTVLTPEGLTVVSDFTSNPSGLFTPQGDGPRVETETTDVKILLRDGRELPARFVLRDRDLDLAFLMPQEKIAGLAHLPLEKGPVPEALDDLFFLYPMGRSLNREVAVALSRVRAVSKKPRIFVVSDFLDAFQSLGCPAFDGAGRAVGLVVLRRAPGSPMGQSGPRELLDFFSPVVLTAADVQQVAVQAAAAKAEAP